MQAGRELPGRIERAENTPSIAHQILGDIRRRPLAFSVNQIYFHSPWL